MSAEQGGGWVSFSAAGNCADYRELDDRVELRDRKAGVAGGVITASFEQFDTFQKDIRESEDPREIVDSSSGISITPEATPDGTMYVFTAEGQEAALGFNTAELSTFVGGIVTGQEAQLVASGQQA